MLSTDSKQNPLVDKAISSDIGDTCQQRLLNTKMKPAGRVN